MSRSDAVRAGGRSSDDRQVPDWVAAASLAGIVGVTLYVASWAVAGAIRPGYDASRQAISQLFELGAPTLSRSLVVVGLVVSGIALIVFGAALHRGLPGRGLGAPVSAVVSGVMTMLVVVFPCAEGCPGVGASFTDTMHVVVAGAGYVTLMLAPLLAAPRVWAYDRRLAWWSLALGGFALVGFVVRNLGGFDATGGLQQRIFNTTADLWYVVVGVWMLRRWRAGASRITRSDQPPT
jgi:hypothetical membrane protein